MRKGQIIRRKLTSGTPIGTYMEIDNIVNGRGVYAHGIDPSTTLGSIFIPKREIYEVRTVCLGVTHEDIQRLITLRPIVCRHALTLSWDKACNVNDYEAAILINQYSNQKVLVTNPAFQKVVSSVHINRKMAISNKKLMAVVHFDRIINISAVKNEYSNYLAGTNL